MKLTEIKSVSVGSESKNFEGTYYNYLSVDLENGKDIFVTYDTQNAKIIDDVAWDFIAEKYADTENYKQFMSDKKLRSEVEELLGSYIYISIDENGDAYNQI